MGYTKGQEYFNCPMQIQQNVSLGGCHTEFSILYDSYMFLIDTSVEVHDLHAISCNSVQNWGGIHVNATLTEPWIESGLLLKVIIQLWSSRVI